MLNLHRTGIINIHIGFAHIHQYMCIYSVLTRVLFKKTQAYYSGGIRAHDHCNSRAGSYQTTEIARLLKTFLLFEPTRSAICRSKFLSKWTGMLCFTFQCGEMCLPCKRRIVVFGAEFRSKQGPIS